MQAQLTGFLKSTDNPLPCWILKKRSAESFGVPTWKLHCDCFFHRHVFIILSYSFAYMFLVIVGQLFSPSRHGRSRNELYLPRPTSLPRPCAFKQFFAHWISRAHESAAFKSFCFSWLHCVLRGRLFASWRCVNQLITTREVPRWKEDWPGFIKSNEVMQQWLVEQQKWIKTGGPMWVFPGSKACR